MKNRRIRPSELLKLRKETGQSYWDLVGNPLPKYDPDHGDYIQFPTQGDARYFSEHYKKYFPKHFEQFKGGKDKFSTFAGQLGPLVYEGLKKRGYNSRTTYDNVMRQLAYESAYGTSNVARNYHNYGGVGHRVVNGKDVYTKYASDQSFIDNYLNLMVGKYSKALQAKDTLGYARALHNAGYYEDDVNRYTNNLMGMQSVSKAAAKYWKPLNEVTLDALTEEPDATRVAPSVIQVNRLKKPTQTHDDVMLPLEDTSTNDNTKVPFKPNTQLPNLIDVYNNMFDMDLPTMNKGKDLKKVERFNVGDDQDVDAYNAAQYMSGGIGVPVGTINDPEGQGIDYVVNTPDITVLGTAPKMSHSEIIGGKPFNRPLQLTHPEFDALLLGRSLVNDLLPINEYTRELYKRRAVQNEFNKLTKQWDGRTVGEEYFNSPEKWYRVTEYPEISAIKEVGGNQTTIDATNTANKWRNAILDKHATSRDGYWHVGKRNENMHSGYGISLTKRGAAHGNMTQAAKGKVWGGTVASSYKFPIGYLEGNFKSSVHRGMTKNGADSRSRFVLQNWDDIPIGARIGFRTGEMPTEGLYWYQRLNNGRYSYEPVLIPPTIRGYSRDLVKNKFGATYRWDVNSK